MCIRDSGGGVRPYPARTSGIEPKPAFRTYGHSASHYLRHRERSREPGRGAREGSCPCPQLPSRRTGIPRLGGSDRACRINAWPTGPPAICGVYRLPSGGTGNRVSTCRNDGHGKAVCTARRSHHPDSRSAMLCSANFPPLPASGERAGVRGAKHNPIPDNSPPNAATRSYFRLRFGLEVKVSRRDTATELAV